MKNLILLFVAFCISLCTFGQSRESAVYYHPELALEGSLEVQHQLLQRTDTKPSVHRAPHKADAVGYNAFLSCGTTGYSISNMSGQIRKTVNFVISNNGESDIELTKLIVKHSKTLLDVTSITSAEYLGPLGAGQSKGLSVTLTSDIDVVFEWEYTYNGECYIYQSWDYTVTKVEAISLNYSELDLMAGEKATLTATVSPADATVPDLTWESENKSIAVIDGAGNVMGIAPGETAIKVSTVDGSGVTAKCRVRVTPNTSELEDPDIYNPYLSSYSTGYSQFNNRKTINFTLQNRGNESIYVTSLTIKRSDTLDDIYTSTDTSLLGNLDAGGSFGLSYTVYQNISFAFEWEYLYHGHSYIYQSWKSYPFKVRGITLDYTSLELGLGETATLTATVTPAEAKGNVVWTSSNESVVTVDDAGNLTTVGAGTATITVASKDDASKCATCEVTVIRYSITSLTIDSEDFVLSIGKEITLTAISSPSNAYNKNVVWSSSNEAVATVSSEGHVRAIAEGEAVITVASEENPNIRTSVKITVKDLEVRNIILNIETAELKAGEGMLLEAIVSPETAVNKAVRWYSSDESIVSISPSGYIQAIRIGSSIITVKSESNPEVTATAIITVVPTMVESVTLNHSVYTLWAHEHLQLTAVVTPEDATNCNIVWTSSDTDIAVVDDNGYVTANAGGTAIITATAADGSGVFATCELTVLAVAEITLDATAFNLKVGESATITATVSPDNVEDNRALWYSSNRKVATVSAIGRIVRVTALAQGTATITAISMSNPTVKTTATITVEDYRVKNIELNTTECTLRVGDCSSFIATVAPSDAVDKTIRWSTSNDGIVMVSADGRVIARSVGTAFITATSNSNPNVFATVKLTVVPRWAESITLNYYNYSLTKDESVQLIATITPGIYCDQDLIWASSNENVVKVDSNGLCVGVGDGEATVTVTTTDGSNLSASCVFGCVVGIENLTADDSDDDVFSIDGIKRNKVQQGVNIIRRKDGKSFKMLKLK